MCSGWQPADIGVLVSRHNTRRSQATFNHMGPLFRTLVEHRESQHCGCPTSHGRQNSSTAHRAHRRSQFYSVAYNLDFVFSADFGVTVPDPAAAEPKGASKFAQKGRNDHYLRDSTPPRKPCWTCVRHIRHKAGQEFALNNVSFAESSTLSLLQAGCSDHFPVGFSGWTVVESRSCGGIPEEFCIRVDAVIHVLSLGYVNR
jgi:hypothetical protein